MAHAGDHQKHTDNALSQRAESTLKVSANTGNTLLSNRTGGTSRTVTIPFSHKQPVEMNNSRNNCMISYKDSLVDLFIFCLTLLMSAGFFLRQNWFKLKKKSFLEMQTQVSVI